jgi:hypothetical protein
MQPNRQSNAQKQAAYRERERTKFDQILRKQQEVDEKLGQLGEALRLALQRRAISNSEAKHRGN